MKTNRSYKRGDPHRDARLFVIACEGVKRETDYFRYFQNKTQRIQIIISEPDIDEEGKQIEWRSAPKWILDWAVRKAEELDFQKDDILWFVLDIDKWGDKVLFEIKNICDSTPGWHIALSNPCFEVWLYFHIKSTNKSKSNTCKQFKSELNKIVKGNASAESFAEKIKDAIPRAKNSDSDPSHFLPKPKETKVYLLAEMLMEFINKGNTK